MVFSFGRQLTTDIRSPRFFFISSNRITWTLEIAAKLRQSIANIVCSFNKYKTIIRRRLDLLTFMTSMYRCMRSHTFENNSKIHIFMHLYCVFVYSFACFTRRKDLAFENLARDYRITIFHVWQWHNYRTPGAFLGGGMSPKAFYTLLHIFYLIDKFQYIRIGYIYYRQ